MSFDIIRSEIETYLKDGFKSLPIHYSNTRFDQPEEWLQVSLFFTDTTQVSMGDIADIRTEIQLIMTLFTSLNKGSGRSFGYADELALLFDRKRVGTTQFRVANIQTNAIQDAFYSSQVSITGFSDKTN